MKNKNRSSLAYLTETALLIALSMAFSFLESRIPAFVAVPGMKIGLANIAVLVALYRRGAPTALGVSVVRVALSALLFGNTAAFLYSAAGAVFAFLVMLLLRSVRVFSPVGVSIGGGVAHNLAQIGVACLLLRSSAALFYLPALLVSGTVAGTVIGIAGALAYRALAGIR